MKTISIKQPWAYLLAAGIKDIENRSWHTNFRGTVLIHASAEPDKRFLDPNFKFKLSERTNFKIKLDEVCKLSAIIGKMEIVDCISNSKSIWAEKDQYHWVIKNAELFKIPFLNVKGKLSFWEFEPEAKKQSDEPLTLF